MKPALEEKLITLVAPQLLPAVLWAVHEWIKDQAAEYPTPMDTGELLRALAYDIIAERKGG